MSSIFGYSASSRSISPCVRSTSARSLGVHPPAPACCSVLGQRRQRPEPGLGQIADRRLIEQRAGPGPVRGQPRAVRLVQGQCVDLDQMRQRQRRIAAAPPRGIVLAILVSVLIEVGRRPVGAVRSGREPAQIVEAELRRCGPGKLHCGLFVQIAQQPVAQPLAGHRPQLLLDGLQRSAERRSPRQRLLQIEQARIEPHRIEAGEPAHRSGQVDRARHQTFFTAVAFEVEQHRVAATMMGAT